MEKKIGTNLPCVEVELDRSELLEHPDRLANSILTTLQMPPEQFPAGRTVVYKLKFCTALSDATIEVSSK
ncbi:hypothetical protein [Desulfovibrio psychrotolerans]|uniref:Uncharacterized protein n=1 Tax=Desulfovibrio psychrotolerans TaxID=415242 RepID=A0A7J0BRE6_9BACT|nr:hypothetical protein [Desulfovibrio psychrotolerans]GFM36250.1 hypothetical protein DSM19430T_09340 [Desulfovibrio psychrotolerans]